MQRVISRIKKRDGTVTDFVQGKITNAVYRAMESHGLVDNGAAKSVSDIVTFMLEDNSAATPCPR